MPLTRNSVTAASRIMLPTYPAFFGVVGLGLLITAVDRLVQTPVFKFADDHGNIRWWGWGFVALAVTFVTALLVRRRSAYKVALAVGVIWMSLWSMVTAASSITSAWDAVVWLWFASIGLLVLAVTAQAQTARTIALAALVGVIGAIAWPHIAAATSAGASSFTAWAWPAFVARACWASLISLETRET